jgi:hypothetical protein
MCRIAVTAAGTLIVAVLGIAAPAKTIRDIVPRLDIEKSCHGAATASLPEDQANAFKVCIADEQTARSKLEQIWSKAPSKIRLNCIDETTRFSASYVDLLTCLEMASGGSFSTAATQPQAPANANPAPAK